MSTAIQILLLKIWDGLDKRKKKEYNKYSCSGGYTISIEISSLLKELLNQDSRIKNREKKKMSDKGFNRFKAWLEGDPHAESEEDRKGILEVRGLSVNDLAKGIGITRATIYYYMQDRRRPSPKMLDRICKFLNVPLSIGAQYGSTRSVGGQWKNKSQ